MVKAYVRGEYETEKFGEVNTYLRNTSERSFSLAALNMPAMQFVMYGTILSILWFGGNLVIGEHMKVGALTSFLSYVLQVLNSLMMFSNVFLLFTRSLTSWRRISEVLVEEPEIRDDRATDIEITREVYSLIMYISNTGRLQKNMCFQIYPFRFYLVRL